MSAASPAIVLVTFHSRCGSTETRALALAVGAVQVRAAIRMRRVAEESAERTLAELPECGDTLRRMHKEYVTPTEADVIAADAIVLGPPPGSLPSSPEWMPYAALLRRLGADGKLDGKVGAVVECPDPATEAAFADLLLRAGLVTVPAGGAAAAAAGPESATAHGRRVASVARALKTAG
jgi:hypothetical protein